METRCYLILFHCESYQYLHPGPCRRWPGGATELQPANYAAGLMFRNNRYLHLPALGNTVESSTNILSFEMQSQYRTTSDLGN